MTDNITIPRATVQQALKALETGLAFSTHSPVLGNLRTALEQQAEPVQEPVAQSDLVKRLRETASKGVSVWGNLQMEAAREIEILRAERDCYASAMDKMLAASRAEPIGWLDGNDKLAEFMHRDLKADHDKRGSATPRDFTVPVYTTPPQRKPLTGEEITNIVREVSKGSALRPMNAEPTSVRIARAIEAAHGIKGGA